MRLQTLINESDERLFHKMGNQAHCLHSILPPLPCSATLQTRPKGHPYELPRYKYDLSRKSFVLWCLYNFVWFYVFWLYDFICAFHIRLICVQLKSLPWLQVLANIERPPLRTYRPEPISAVSGSKFTILSGHVKEVLLLNKFFFRLSIHALVAMIWPDKVVRWCRDGDFWRLFCVLYLQRAACSAFQTCILNSH